MPLWLRSFFLIFVILILRNIFESFALPVAFLPICYVSSQKVLAKHGATKISAYVTHGIFPNRSWERFQHDNGGMNILF